LQYPTAEHLRHHRRFYLAALCGVVVAAAALGTRIGLPVTFGGVTFYAIYLASTAFVARELTTDDLRRKASAEDEGITLIALITLAAIALSLGSLAMLLGDKARPLWHLVPAVANVPLGWATLHTVMAFHYAHLFYSSQKDASGKTHDMGGLEFPKTKEPSIFDFVYYAFVVGMTAQVSDVDTTSRAMRNATIIHGVVSFFFNTVILAFTVNVLTSG
jgi:uncharacterized membrane protein